MRCLYGIKDDLHAYAERVVAMALPAPIMERGYGPVHSALLHREGEFQTELVRVAPGAELPQHRHPGVDSIECPLEGFIRFRIGGEDPYATVSDERLARFAIGKLVRIAGKAWHSGKAGPEGAVFLSMQRWTGEQVLIGERWEGATVSEEHASLAQATEGFVPLTAGLMEAFYGFPPPRTVQGYAYLEGGKPIVVMGVRRDPGYWGLFSDSKPESRGRPGLSSRRLLLKGAAKMIGVLSQVRGPVFALAECVEGSERLLERMGFRHYEGRIYQWRR